MKLIDAIPMLNPFDLKPGLFRYSLQSVILIHEIDYVNDLVILSPAIYLPNESLRIDDSFFKYRHIMFLESYASTLYDIFTREDLNYLADNQYEQLKEIYEMSKEE